MSSQSATLNTSDTDGKAVARDPRRWLILAVMSLGTLIVFLDLTVVNTALPSIASDLGASNSDLQWVVDSYVLVLAGLLMLAGSIGDRYGRKRWMTAGLLFFALGSVVGGLATSVETLILARAIQGLGAAFVLPATLSIVTNTFDRDERGKAIAIWTAVGGIGIGFGPAIGGYLIDRWDWSAAFWIHIPVIAVALVGQTVVKESRDPRHVGLDVPGAVTATLGISALVFAIIQGNEAGWTSPLIISSFTAAAILLAAFVRIEQRAKYPMLPLKFFRNRDFTGSVLVIGMMFFAGPATFFFLTQFFQLVQGRDPFEAGLLILPNAAAIVFASALAPTVTKRFGPKRTVMFSVATMALAAALFAGIESDWSSLHEIGLIMLFGFGFGLGMPALTDSIMAAVPVEDAGVGSAVNDVSRELGSALGIAVLGSFISALYRSNVDDVLTGQVDGDVVEMAQEGLGVLAGQSATLTPDVAQTAFAGASSAFIDAMNSGFWLSAAVLASGVVIAAVMLPNKARVVQVERTPDEAEDPIVRIDIVQQPEPALVSAGDGPPN
ncbi:MAG: MFS transporter [Acidobacteria bacterium]|nr:MFS transporter [Acidobacteriota bacterium]